MSKAKRWVAGIDEAGRGPLAGPVTLAMVLMPERRARRAFEGIKDSKHLTPSARKDWLLKLKFEPKINFWSASVGPRVIDNFGIQEAIKRAIKRLLNRVPQRRIFGLRVLLDGGLKAPLRFSQKTIIKGDERVPVIAAASIVAKVSRDRKMVRFSKKYPNYAFDAHKGYGTSHHYKMLKKHGLCEIHRRTFLTKIL